ncbi:DedA family protein [Aerosakkonema funiforme]|uniref:DedA family protein n=1 Tax=Aerosakkonema funiforme TaxID=1246630 RepID=UPI0035B79EB0
MKKRGSASHYIPNYQLPIAKLMQEWITNTMTSLGYVGIGLLMFLENLFPPIPSELIMPLAGFTIAQKQMAFFPAILAGVIGTMLGALPWYYVGKLVGEENLKRLADKYGKWISISSRDIEKADNWFDRHGEKAVFFCRLVPGVRTLISLPAGMSGMHLVPFLIYSTVGTTLWVGFLTYAGYILGEKYELVDEYLGPVSKIVFVGLVVAFVVWIVRKRQKSKIKNM